MSWKETICMCIILLGIILFLYGANYFNAVFGWTGGCFIVGGFLAEIIVKIYESIWKK